MKRLIDHLFRTNLDEILSKSLLHCHAKNVHSIMLLCCPEKTIRLFVAESNHELYANAPWTWQSGLTVGFHAHHCELTLCPVSGVVTNWIVKHTGVEWGAMGMGVFDYHSAIGGGVPSFTKDGSTLLSTVGFDSLSAESRDVQYMSANAIHTVSVMRGEPAAWLVFEGKEDLNYKPVTYSNTDLEKFDFSELYKPVTKLDLFRLLNLAFSVRPYEFSDLKTD